MALVLFAIGIVVGFVPVRGTAVEQVQPNRAVGCGTFWIANEWSSDVGCDRVLTARFAWIAIPVVLSLPLGLLGGMLLLLDRDRQRWSRNRLLEDTRSPSG